ncbi:hypothetical protein OROMI_005217 [Orobanche minor]
MFTTTMKALSLLLFTFDIALTCLALPTQSYGDCTTRYNVTILNLSLYVNFDINPSITIRCASKDKDIGSHVLADRFDSFTWDVCVKKFGEKPVFICDFSFENLKAKITVFDQDISKYCKNNACTWIARQKEIFLETPGATSPWSYTWGS